MSFTEKDLRDRAKIINERYAFWDEKIQKTLAETDELVAGFDDTDEEYILYQELEEKMVYLLGHLEIEKKEIVKLEKDIRQFNSEDEK